MSSPPTLITAFRASRLVTRDYPRESVIDDIVEETGLSVDAVSAQLDAGLALMRKKAGTGISIMCDMCRPCQRTGGCDPDQYLDQIRCTAGLSVAGYILGLSREIDGLEAALRSCNPWHRHHIREGNREGEIARRWAAGDTKNACRMMRRP